MDSRRVLGGSFRTSRILPGLGPLPLPVPKHRRHADTSTSKNSQIHTKPLTTTVTKKELEVARFKIYL